MNALTILIENGGCIIKCRDNLAKDAYALKDQRLKKMISNMRGFDSSQYNVKVTEHYQCRSVFNSDLYRKFFINKINLSDELGNAYHENFLIYEFSSNLKKKNLIEYYNNAA